MSVKTRKRDGPCAGRRPCGCHYLRRHRRRHFCCEQGRLATPPPDTGTTRPGYYRDPAIHGDTIVFTAEGDLWTVSVKGGAARRLTSNPGRESGASISPEGRTVAFRAEYEGPAEVYTMPVEGGLPQCLTWDGDAAVAGWTPDGRVLVRTGRYSTLPDPQLVAIDSHGRREVVPLAQAAEGSYTPDGRTLSFTRYNRQGSSTKRYQGGTAENIWRYDSVSEAAPLTADWPGTSHDPMFWDGRVYFLSDRDGVMNVYSMDRNGHGLRQHTHQRGFDIQWASLSDGRIAYQCGADLWLLGLKNTGDIHALTSDRHNSFNPAWSDPRPVPKAPPYPNKAFKYEEEQSHVNGLPSPKERAVLLTRERVLHAD